MVISIMGVYHDLDVSNTFFNECDDDHDVVDALILDFSNSVAFVWLDHVMSDISKRGHKRFLRWLSGGKKRLAGAINYYYRHDWFPCDAFDYIVNDYISDRLGERLLYFFEDYVAFDFIKDSLFNEIEYLRKRIKTIGGV